MSDAVVWLFAILGCVIAFLIAHVSDLIILAIKNADSARRSEHNALMEVLHKIAVDVNATQIDVWKLTRNLKN